MTVKHPGRKPIGEKNLIRVNVMLDERHIEQARRLGHGNVSAGVRAAIDATDSAWPVVDAPAP